MTKLNKLTIATAFAALLGAGLVAAPHATFAAEMKGDKAMGDKAMGDKGHSLDYPRFNPNYLKGIG